MLVATVIAIHLEDVDNMSVIHTVAPIPLVELKKYFEDKTISFVIDLEQSTLSGAKFLTYIANLDLPVDLLSNEKTEKFNELLVAYFKHPLILNLPVLEKTAIDILLQFKGIADTGHEQFISDNQEIVQRWSDVLDSLCLFNLYCVNSPELKEWVEGHPLNDTSSSEGINFVSLLKNPEFYNFYTKHNPERVQFYKNYFQLNMFKGTNLFSYWSNENNPMFLLTFGIAQASFENENYLEAKRASIKELEDVSFV